jgi:hypothetical protein
VPWRELNGEHIYYEQRDGRLVQRGTVSDASWGADRRFFASLPDRKKLETDDLAIAKQWVDDEAARAFIDWAAWANGGKLLTRGTVSDAEGAAE